MHAADANRQFEHLPPLFKNIEEYDAFVARHNRDNVQRGYIAAAREAYLGIDSGSTTIKIAVVAPDGKLLDSFTRATKATPLSPCAIT